MTTETIADSRISEDEIREEHPSVGDVRGVRVFWAAELVNWSRTSRSESRWLLMV